MFQKRQPILIAGFFFMITLFALAVGAFTSSTHTKTTQHIVVSGNAPTARNTLQTTTTTFTSPPQHLNVAPPTPSCCTTTQAHFIDAMLRAKFFAAASKPRPPTPHTDPSVQVVAQPAAVNGQGMCGGDLPPCYVCIRESHCTYGIVSPNEGCTGYRCYGKWQFDPRTYSNAARVLGYPSLFDPCPGNINCLFHPERWASVTPAMEDGAAREVWNGGRNCSAWNAC